jgi:TolB-like protein/DNA-binding winged helix-turn-helix (wHTH) protein
MSEAPLNNPSGYRVGDISIDLARRRVSRDNKSIKLGKLSYKLLVVLVQSAPRVVTRDELVEHVWDGRFVNPPTIKQRIVLLRQALDDDANKPRYINVVRGHGYTIIPQVEVLYEQPNTRRLWPAYALGLLIGITLLVGIYRVNITPIHPADPPSVAVLPFENLSPEPVDSFFATGLHEEVIEKLSRIEGIRTVSRRSVQRFAESPTAIQDVARELNVDAVMEGTVHYRDGRVRIRTQLVDPDNGIQLWSKTFEREFSDIFEIQNEIAKSVAGTLGVKLGIGTVNAFRGAGTTSIEAYEAFLAGLDVLGQVQGQDRAISLFKRATELDPEYAAAWAQIGFAIAAKSFYSPPEHTTEILNQALPPLLRAVELDPQSARAASMLGFVRYFRLDWISAAEEFERAIDLRADHLTLSQHAGLLSRAGRVTAARTEFDAAEAVERSFGRSRTLQAKVSIAQSRFAEARELVSTEGVATLRLRTMLHIALAEGNPEAIKDAMSDLMTVDAASSSLMEQLLSNFESPDAALAIIRTAQADRNVRWPAKQNDIALFAAYFGDPQLAIKSFSQEVGLSIVRIGAIWYPIMSDARQMPEFKSLVTDLNLVSYWRAYGWPDVCTPMGETDFRCS